MSVTTPTKPVVEESTRRWELSESTKRGLLLAVFLVALVVFFATQSTGFLTPASATTILTNSAVIGIVALGQLLTIISGGFDLSVSGIVPLGSVVFALVANATGSMVAGLAASLIAGLVAGVVNGLVIVYLRISPLITTLGMLSITGGLALTLAGGIQVPLADVTAGVLARPGLFGINNHVLLWLALSIIVFVVLRFTVYGRSLYAMGGNPEAARLAGLPVRPITISVYATSGVLAGLAGVILTSQLLTGSGLSGTNMGLQTIAAVILGGAALSGGVGGVPGTLVGVLVLGVLSVGMAIMSVPSFYQTIATGVVLLLAVALSQIGRRRTT